MSAPFNKFVPAFWTGNADLPLSFGNAYFLFAGRASIDSVYFFLLCDIFFFLKKAGYLIFILEELCIFPVTILVVFRKHTEVSKYQKQ